MPPDARVTIADVARAAGVHASTVSRALNPATRAMVREDVATRVEHEAARLGWRPSAIAAGLRTRRSRTVAILVPDLVNPVFPPIVRAAETELATAGYVTLLANTDNDAAREELLIRRMAEHLVDGLMLASAARGTRAVELCAALRIPVVLINRRMPGSAVSAVINDDAAGIALAVAHLVELGHCRIAHLAGPPGVSTAIDRRAGFRAAIRAAGLDVSSIMAAQAYTAEAGLTGMRTILAGPPVTAVVAANDLLSLGIYDALTEAGLRPGTDVSVTGFNDMPFVDRINPSLTTVRIQHAEMGRRGATLLLEELTSHTRERRDLRLRPRLIVRESTQQRR